MEVMLGDKPFQGHVYHTLLGQIYTVNLAMAVPASPGYKVVFPAGISALVEVATSHAIILTKLDIVVCMEAVVPYWYKAKFFQLSCIRTRNTLMVYIAILVKHS